MSNEAESQATEQPRDPAALVLYTNLARVRTRAYDTVVSLLLENNEGERSHVADIHMSPAHAKSLAYLLASQVAEYERVTGTKLPDPAPKAVSPSEPGVQKDTK